MHIISTEEIENRKIRAAREFLKIFILKLGGKKLSSEEKTELRRLYEVIIYDETLYIIYKITLPKFSKEIVNKNLNNLKKPN